MADGITRYEGAIECAIECANKLEQRRLEAQRSDLITLKEGLEAAQTDEEVDEYVTEYTTIARLINDDCKPFGK